MTVSRFPRPFTPLTHSSMGRSCVRWRPGALLVAALVAALVATPTFSALRVGTKNAETLTGTKGNDQLTGAEGNDLLKGLAGNDTYFFADGWGSDELVEKPGEGTDTLNFRGVHTSAIDVHLVREWDPAFSTMYADGPRGAIDFSTAAGQATIEKVIGGQGDNDLIETGSGPHTLQPGGGAQDEMHDAGGYDDGPGGFPELPVSNDIFKGFGDNTGTDLLFDFGGSGDVVDMRPFSTADVYLSRRDFDARGSEESLQIVTGPTSQVILIGHFSEFLDYTSRFNMQGRIEKLIFADTTITSAKGLAAAPAASAKTTSGKQATLAEAADRLAEEAGAHLAEMPEPGTRRGSESGGDEGGLKPGGEPAKTHKADTKQTTVTKAPPEKKQATKTKSRHEKQQATKASREKKPATKATHEQKSAAKAAKPRAQRR
jgi:hypothetical protein